MPAHPYLLTRREIELFFAAAARLQTPSPWRWQAVAFFTLMHSCGLRTGETRALRTGHVDLRCRHIDIVWSKGNRSRRLPADRSGRRVLGHLRPDIASALRRRAGRSSSPPPATRSPRQRSGRCSTASGTRPGCPGPPAGIQPRPYDFRHHFAYANIERWMSRGQRRHRDAALPVSLHGPRDLRQHLLLHPHLSRLHGRLRRHHPANASPCCRRSDSDETRPATPARRTSSSFARDYLHAYMPKIRGLSPKTIEAYRISLECFLDYLAEAEHIERERVSFDHFDRQHLKAWLAWMTDQRHYAPQDRHAAPERRQGVPGLRGRTKTSRSSRSARQPEPSKPRLAPQAHRVPHRSPRRGPILAAFTGQHGEIPPEPDAAHPALRHRRARGRDHRPDPAGPLA